MRPRSPEQILLQWAHQFSGRRYGCRPVESAHQHDRLRLRRLALEQRSGRGDLVGKSDDADFKNATEQIRLTAQVDQAWQSRRTDRDATRAAAPRATETVADDDT